MKRTKAWTMILLLLIGASHVFSQQGGKNSSDQSLPKAHTVSVVVTDPSGAVIPEAELTIATYVIGVEVGRKTTNSSGEAGFLLQSGVTYKLSATADGYGILFETFKLERDMVERVTLQLGRGGGVCTLCVTETNPISLEDVRLTISIPEQPVTPLPLRTRHYHHSRD